MDDAILAIARDYPSLKGVLSMEYAHPRLDKQGLGQRIDLIGNIGLDGFVLANGSMSSNQAGEEEIRQNIIEADLAGCMVALPGQLFYSTQIPVCLWFIARDKKNSRFRDRRGETLFIDARKMGTMIDRVHREFTDEDIRHIAATLEDIRGHHYILTPGRYVGAAAVEEDDEPFEEKMGRLVAQWREQQAEAAKLDAIIAANLKDLGYGA